MLGKLIKNEFRNTWKMMGIVSIAVLIMHLLMHILETMNSSGNFRGIAFNVVHKIYSITYILGMISVNILIAVFMLSRYYRKVYSNEGYLTHTLPVKKWAITSSMLISGFIWSAITAILSSLYIMYRIFGTYATRYRLNDLMSITNGESTTLFFMNIIMIGIIFYMTAFFSISIGQNFKSHPTLASIITYVIFYILIQNVMAYLILRITNESFFGITYSANAYDVMSGGNLIVNRVLLINFIGCLIISVIFFFCK